MIVNLFEVDEAKTKLCLKDNISGVGCFYGKQLYTGDCAIYALAIRVNSDRLAWLITFSKWRFIRDYIKRENKYIYGGMGTTCGLCLRYSCGEYGIDCPIALFTKDSQCAGTPYHFYHRYGKVDYPMYEVLDTVRNELKFLFKVYKQWKKDNPKGDL